MMCILSVAKLAQALALGYLLQSFEVAGGEEAYLWAGVLFLCGLVILLMSHQMFLLNWRKGMQYRISCVAAIYDKSLRLNSTSCAAMGSAVNISTNDAERFLLTTLFVSNIFWAPVQTLAILGVGWWVIGWSFAVGFGLLIFFFIPMQVWLSKKFAIMRSKIAAITDRRVSLVSQAVSGVRVMKLSGWEDNFEERIASIRKEEIDSIERVNKYRILDESIYFFCNVTTSGIIFIIHVTTGGTLTPRNVFTTMALINLAQIELTKYLSLAVMSLSECWVSIKRIQRFLSIPELQRGAEQPLAAGDDKDTAIITSQVTCYWNGNGTDTNTATSDASDNLSTDASKNSIVMALDGISVEFRAGTLTNIIGTVGSGKSALIQMLAGELQVSAGTVRRRDGKMAYAPQDPWIMDGTVKENILMGLAFKPELYDVIIRACALDVDLAQLHDGEGTIVGDRGVQLSGGQRARIALARAFYRDAPVMLLDDPLSAVDSKVGRLLFYSAIQDLGLKRGKCVILATHQHQFIGEHRCIMMTGGRIGCIGSLQECVQASNGKLRLASHNQSTDDLAKLDLPPEEASSVEEGNINSSRGGNQANAEDPKKTQKSTDDHKEESRTGVVQRESFLTYFRAMPGGLLTASLMVVLYAATQGSVLAFIAATGLWSGVAPEDQMSGRIIGVVAGIVATVIVLASLRAYMSFHLMIQASKKLHDEMTRSVLRARVEFFDTNPLGRILNRFSADVGSTDDQLPVCLFDFSVLLFITLGAVASAIYVLPITLVVTPPMVWYFVRVRATFLKTSRELKRLDGLARSPIFAMLSESLTGIATIRANGALEYFQDKFRRVHDGHGRVFFAFIACSRWLGFRMDAIMFVFLTVASFAATVVHQQGWLGIDPGILGLALSMIIQLSGVFQWCVRQSAEVVNHFVAVERVIGFRDSTPEAALTNDYDREVTDWPGKGEIDVKDLSIRYRSGLPLSLCGITFKIQGGCRVGIVGRTGGGKSTLVQSLLRLLEAEGGQIMIDGVDISKLGLHKLRTSISVIPQSPVLFGGCSLRENLDPFHHHNDEQIGEVLSDVHMSEAVQSLYHGLDTTVAEGGSNFSVGQRQLLCLARAILRKNKILVLDEPTANVDSHTDKLLQEAVAKSFRGATILAVAHRLDTVIDYDKILVLGAGGVLEYGSPHQLIKSGGAFCSMVHDTGEEMAELLKARACSNSIQ